MPSLSLPALLQPASTLMRWAWALAFVSTYVFLDWVSYFDSFPWLNISPWNLAPALGLLFLLEKGAGGFLTLAAAMLLAQVVVRPTGSGWLVMIPLCVMLAFGYKIMASSMATILKDQGVTNRSALVDLIVSILTGTYIISMTYVSTLAMTGLLPPGVWAEPLLDLWLGGVGILTTLPLMWLVRNRTTLRYFVKSVFTAETFGYCGVAVVALLISAETGLGYFYALFVPLVWAATRQGLCGAALSVALLHIGLALAAEFQATPDVSLVETQMRILTLALVGFFIGVTVDEQKLVAIQLRDTMRLATAGEMAGAIAHELNQPLTALSAYSSACRLLVKRNQIDKLPEVVEQIIVECNRASETVRRLRDLFGSGTTSLSHFTVADLLSSPVAYFQKSIADTDIILNVDISAPTTRIHGDRVQLEILLRNLLANAKDAVMEGTRRPGLVDLSARMGPEGRLLIRVMDNGAGIASAHARRLFDAFFSTKSSGLGLGLAICREIANAHGGKIALVPGESTCFEFSLPIEN